jgi:hypothetical protein
MSNVTIQLANTAAGSNVRYVAFRDYDKFLIGVGNTTSGDGTYVIPWYDDTANVVVLAYSSTDRSCVAFPQNTSSTFLLDLAAPGSSNSSPSSATYFSYIS